MTISLDVTDPFALDRCEVGTLHLVRRVPGYDTEAVVPGDAWTPLTFEQLNELHPGTDTPAGALIELITFPDAPGYDAEPETIAAYRPRPEAGAHRLLAFTDSPADQLTTTVDHSTGNHLGLHLDNFDQQPTRTREHSRRRLAINLGPGHRYLILATATIQDIADELRPFPRFPHTNDVRRYLSEGGVLRCIRVRMDPGDGYIAPTELIPHDGSTRGATQPSRIAFWLGHWPNRDGTLEAPGHTRMENGHGQLRGRAACSSDPRGRSPQAIAAHGLGVLRNREPGVDR